VRRRASFGACRDAYGAAGYQGNGAFTIALCDAWPGGDFEGSYPVLHAKILQLTNGPHTQTPQYNEYEVVSGFREQRPFIIESTPSDSEECHTTARVELTSGQAAVHLDTDFGLPAGSKIPLARQKGAFISVVVQADAERNGHAII
jgi:hypothetical protein